MEKIPKNKRDGYRYESEQTFLIDPLMTFVINLTRINKMKTQIDTEILWQINNLMLKWLNASLKPYHGIY